ncbi:MAG TPA: hypothetical protein VKE51_14720 [Vicinamibacterales bacterium]|nr:hypothetical protein [Vicinamibacterales bacterium]
MSFLYRFGITITRKAPYIEWANRVVDGPELTEDLARAQRTIYLAPETTEDPDLEALLEEFWEQIFEAELSVWAADPDDWPTLRTRAVFDLWFDAEATASVYDLTPDEPLTQTDVELMDLDVVMHRCAWCEAELDDHTGRFVAFKVADRERLAHRAGLAVGIPVDDERTVIGVMSPDESNAAREGEDIAFRACTSQCEKALRKSVPTALRKVFAARS